MTEVQGFLTQENERKKLLKLMAKLMEKMKKKTRVKGVLIMLQSRKLLQLKVTRIKIKLRKLQIKMLCIIGVPHIMIRVITQRIQRIMTSQI